VGNGADALYVAGFGEVAGEGESRVGKGGADDLMAHDGYEELSVVADGGAE